MNYKNAETDSGSYVNGIYVTKNGFTGSGLNCPKGTRLYDSSVYSPIFFKPQDSPADERFIMIDESIADKDILPYYAISNYGRVMNVNSGKVMKPNYRPNGYEYLCLAADNCKHGQKKYTTHRMVLKAFAPLSNSDELQVNHISGDKTDNSLSNLEWVTAQENTLHRNAELDAERNKLCMEDATNIREIYNQGYPYTYIQSNYYPEVSVATIQNICTNKVYYDPSYSVNPDRDKLNPSNSHRLMPDDVEKIRSLFKSGLGYEAIQKQYYPDFSICALSDIVRHKTHNN